LVSLADRSGGVSKDAAIFLSFPKWGFGNGTLLVKLRFGGGAVSLNDKKIQFRGFMDNGLTGAIDYGDFRGEVHFKSTPP